MGSDPMLTTDLEKYEAELGAGTASSQGGNLSSNWTTAFNILNAVMGTGIVVLPIYAAQVVQQPMVVQQPVIMQPMYAQAPPQPQQTVIVQQRRRRKENYCGPISWIIGIFVFPCICFCPVDERE